MLENGCCAWKGTWILLFLVNSSEHFYGDQDQYKIGLPLFGAAVCCTKLKQSNFKFYTHLYALSQSYIFKVEL